MYCTLKSREEFNNENKFILYLAVKLMYIKNG